MVARSSLAIERGYHYILRLFLFRAFFSLATLSQTLENRHPRNFPTRRGYIEYLCYTDFFKVSPKTNGGRKKTKFAQFFLPSRRQAP